MVLWHWQEHGCLVVGLKINGKLCSGLLPAQDDAHACWEVAASTGVEAADARAAWFRIATTVRGGCHGSPLNARYLLATYSIFFIFLFELLSLDLIP